jgi:hypothetical protein
MSLCNPIEASLTNKWIFKILNVMMLHWLVLSLKEKIQNNVVFFWFHVLNNVHHVFVLVNCEFKFLGTSSTINHILVVANVNLS